MSANEARFRHLPAKTAPACVVVSRSAPAGGNVRGEQARRIGIRTDVRAVLVDVLDERFGLERVDGALELEAAVDVCLRDRGLRLLQFAGEPLDGDVTPDIDLSKPGERREPLAFDRHAR